ncbi:MAG: endopeptidase La [Fluviicola sp.]
MNDPFENNIVIDTIELDDADFNPNLSPEEEKIQNEEIHPASIPILPLRNNVLYPGVLIPISVGREKSLRLIEKANKSKILVGVISQMNQDIENPNFSDLNKVGTLAKIIRIMKLPDGSTTVVLQGKRKFKITDPIQSEPFMEAKVKYINDKVYTFDDAKLKVQFQTIKTLALDIIKTNPNIPGDASVVIESMKSPNSMMNFICSNMDADLKKKQAILEETDILKRAELIIEILEIEAQVVELRNQISNKVRREMDKQQRDYFLHQQIRTIQDELGDNPQDSDFREMEVRSKDKKWDEKVAKLFQKELSKLQRMNPQSAEYTVQLNYLDTLLELPWNDFTKDNLDLKFAEKVLNRDHFGMEKVKERILEYLAVLKLKGDMKSPILCFYGPPGVGKTSLGKSIAEALGRKYVRMSLGGVHDEAEIRGHRKTYIGAMPGRVIQHIKKSQSANPVFILDEIDKLGRSNHGDPSSAMLEVLDPEQNSAFYDNFVETEFDLSKVLFIATANNLSTIQGPLLDRMEIIEVSGYTVEEKVEIAKRHLLPKQLEAHGITSKQLTVDKKVLEQLIDQYTSESGVRSLDKRLAKLARNRAKQVALEEDFKVKLVAEDLVKLLGPGREKTKYDSNEVPGVVTGLAWTSVGGDILFIESSLTQGKGKLTLTGNLGDVMKESAVIALEYLKSHASLLKLEQAIFDERNIHIHVPEGATPKDGPSAGITMLTSIASSFTNRKVKKGLAMTGEITLRGEVLPVGGIKEKILAAKRASIKEIILCERNRVDIEEIEQSYLKGLKFHYVKSMKEVLNIALI